MTTETAATIDAETVTPGNDVGKKREKFVIDIGKFSAEELVRLATDLRDTRCGPDAIVYSGERSAVLPLLKEISKFRQSRAANGLYDYTVDGVLRWSAWHLLGILCDGTSARDFALAYELTKENLVVAGELHEQEIGFFAGARDLSAEMVEDVLKVCAQWADYANGEVHRVSVGGKNPLIRQKIEQARIARAPKHFHDFAIGSVAITEKPYAVAVGSMCLVTCALHRSGGVADPRIEVPREIFSGLDDGSGFVLQVWLDLSGAPQVVILEVEDDDCDCCKYPGEDYMFRTPLAGNHSRMFGVALTAEELLGEEKIADLIRRHHEETFQRLSVLNSYQPPPPTV